MTAASRDTIYALSSGSPPAAIAIVRISGPAADRALQSLAGFLPQPRRAVAATLRLPATGEPLDRALVLRFPGPNSATGEDLAELHLHGGRSVVAAALAALADMDGLRAARPGEFTRRALENGRIDLAEAEGLADLLMAETQSQRRAALSLAGGALSRQVEQWQRRLLELGAAIEALLDFADEDDVGEGLPSDWSSKLESLSSELRSALERPTTERLREGVRVVLAGPPNTGKSSLLNRLAGRDAAITSVLPGTTRDLVEAPTVIGGTPFLLIDTAGLRESGDAIEAIGVDRARQSVRSADVILWLGDADELPDRERSLLVESMSDLRPDPPSSRDAIRVSAVTGEGVDRLTDVLTQRAASLLPRDGEVAINRRHAEALREALSSLLEAEQMHDPLILSECLRRARQALDRITGQAGVEHMLDALFETFCIGK